MDEKTLNELLECSVCLERLDSTSKVLPCQHTFCKRCLEEILITKKELQCPECRTYVTIPIDDLPSNILLIRLLEGMKNVTAMSNPASPLHGAHSGAMRGAGLAASKVERKTFFLTFPMFKIKHIYHSFCVFVFKNIEYAQ